MAEENIISLLLSEFKSFKEDTAKVIISLEQEIVSLKDKLNKYENPKNSSNSSIPPSQDPNRKKRSLRVHTTKKAGAQKGHKGSKLKKSETIDKIVFHNIETCLCCGQELGKEGTLKSRQVFDIPAIRMEVTEHQIIEKNCLNCGKVNKSSFPDELSQEAQYGNRLKSLCVYLQNYQMLPYGRCAEFIKDLTGHQLSQGSLSNFQRKCYHYLEEYELEAKQALLQSSVLHADETGVQVNGRLNWIHVLSNESISFFGHHEKRGKDAINDFGLIPVYKGNLVHDRFSSYFSYNCEHSLCNAHILRELAYIEETYNQPWATEVKNLLIKANHEKKKGGKEFLSQKYYSEILTNFEALITPIIESYNKLYTKTKEERLAFALEKHKHLFLKFIKQPEVPFDNNQAERDLRMIKVKQKVSGCFKADSHAKYFSRIRGYITTLKKNKQDILQSIQSAFELNPFFPNFG